MLILRCRSLRILLSILLFAAVAAQPSAAQATNWGTPASGYVYDPASRAIRPVLGFIGSAVLGAPAVDGVDWAAIAPNNKSAVIRQGSSIVSLPDLAVPGQTGSVDGMDLPRQAAWAGDSSRAVVLSEGEKLVWLAVKGAAPQVEAVWKLNEFIPSGPADQQPRWSLLAADAAADKVLLTVFNGGWQLWLASRTAAPVLVPFDGHPAAAVFAALSPLVYVADVWSHQITRIAQIGSSPTVTPVLLSADYVQNPAGIALSTDEKRLSLIDRNLMLARVIDSGDGSLVSEVPLDEAPDSMTPVTPGRFLLNPANNGGQALYFLETGLPASVFFVPRGE